MSRIAWIVIGLVAVVAVAGGSYWWLNSRTTEVDFELWIRSDYGCSVQHPKYGFVTGGLDLVLRDGGGVKIETVSMYESAATDSRYCVMIGVADIPVKDVYRVQIDNMGKISDAGFVDREEVESGSITLIDT